MNCATQKQSCLIDVGTSPSKGRGLMNSTELCEVEGWLGGDATNGRPPRA
jgi:hypothetical protein